MSGGVSHRSESRGGNNVCNLQYVMFLTVFPPPELSCVDTDKDQKMEGYILESVATTTELSA